MKLKQFIEEVQKGNISVEEHTHKTIEESKKINKEYNYFNNISEDFAIEQAKELDKQIKSKKAKGRLLGLPVSVKDNIIVQGVESTAGSAILKGYIPEFHATAVRKATDEGAIIIGKTAQDEFGFGSFSKNVGVGFKIPLNPFDKTRVTGGSSGGSGGFTQKFSRNHISLGESTGGSIASPAAFCGVVGLTPTYGRVSRYGLIDYGNSLDKIGSMAKSVEDAALMLEIISGKDKDDSTSANVPVEKYASFVKKGIKGMKIGIVKEMINGSDKEVQKAVMDYIKKLEKEGAKYEEISLPITSKYSIAAYYILATAEASTNLAKYCGMRYGKHEYLQGNFNEYFTDVRSKNLGAEAKRRIILGTFARQAGFRDAYYIKAAQVRTVIINEYKKLLSKYDAIVSPTMPLLAPKFSEIEKLTPLQNYLMDIMTVGPNLAGMPHISVNAGMAKGLPVGIMFTSDHFEEKKLIQLASELEE